MPQNQSPTPVYKGIATVLNITAATVVKASAGHVAKVSVIVAGSAPGSINNLAVTSGATTANELAVIANTAGVYDIDMPASVGILVVPGTGQTLAVSYS